MQLTAEGRFNLFEEISVRLIWIAGNLATVIEGAQQRG
jgi:hypothetical protein